MIRGLYTSTAGMAAEMTVISALSNNLANVDTFGFREDFATVLRQSANPLSYGAGGLVRGTGILSVTTGLNLAQGSLRITNNPYDLALQGPGMFALQSPTGTVYTRDGRFHLSATGQLINADGALVLNPQGQPITLPDTKGQTPTITTDGAIAIGQTPVGQIGVFNAAGWTNVGNALYAPAGAATATAITGSAVQQGAVEQANVDLARVMGQIMSAERSYEVAAQMQRVEDQQLQQTAGELGRFNG